MMNQQPFHNEYLSADANMGAIGNLLTSPLPWRNQKDPSSQRPKRQTLTTTRQLDVDNGDSYLVDKDGEEYEPYSLAWRYLGMFIDCDDDPSSGQDNDDDDEERRRRHLSQDNNDPSDSGCKRKVLWAAVSCLVVYYYRI